jgi:hypothetical protein
VGETAIMTPAVLLRRAFEHIEDLAGHVQELGCTCVRRNRGHQRGCTGVAHAKAAQQFLQRHRRRDDMAVTPVLASKFEGLTMLKVKETTAKKLGGNRLTDGSGWVFPDGSRLVLIGRMWRALAPESPTRRTGRKS